MPVWSVQSYSRFPLRTPLSLLEAVSPWLAGHRSILYPRLGSKNTHKQEYHYKSLVITPNIKILRRRTRVLPAFWLTVLCFNLINSENLKILIIKSFHEKYETSGRWQVVCSVPVASNKSNDNEAIAYTINKTFCKNPKTL